MTRARNGPDQRPAHQPKGRAARGRKTGTREGGAAPGKSAGAQARREQRQKRLLTKAKKDPSVVLRDKRCRKEWFCRAFFDHCHDLALKEPQGALETARLAVELAGQTNDRHLKHLAQGVLAHAHINREERDEAARVLDDYRAAALTCCERCASDWHLRQGDLLVEGYDPAGAAVALDHALESLGPEASADDRAHVCFLRCIQHLYAGDLDQAITDACTALRELSLDRPQGYFLDLLAFLACFLQAGGERHHDEQALEAMSLFKDRIKDVRDWTDVRLRYAWVEGQILGRLGRWTEAHERLRKVWRRLRKPNRPHNHALAVACDYCQLYSRRPVSRSYTRMLKILGRCQEWLKLEPHLRKALDIVKSNVSQKPEDSLHHLEVLRRMFIVPVPGIMWDAWRRRRKRASEDGNGLSIVELPPDTSPPAP